MFNNIFTASTDDKDNNNNNFTENKSSELSKEEVFNNFELF